MNFVVILATMTAFWHRGSTQQPERKGKYLGGFGGGDLWNDIFDELDDPIPIPHNSLSVKQQVLQKLQKNKIKHPDPMPLVPIPAQLIEQITTSAPPTTSSSEGSLLNVRRRNATRPEPLILYDTSTHKLEVTPPGFASHVRPITEGMFMIGGKFEEQAQQTQNLTDEKLKLFWSSVGDFIETVPFLPIQVNVPDLLAAMATFFAQRIPLINRITNPNEPRPKFPMVDMPMPSEFQYPILPVDNNLLEYRTIAVTTKPKKVKKKSNKKKGNRRGTTEKYKLKGTYTSTQDPRSQPTSKAWFAKPTEPTAKTTTEDLKLFHHNNSPGNEQVKFKNMPITRKNNRWADRELFNFKHSDISNSPIMILNMPSRPVLLYKFNHQLKTETAH